jgi:hypothetical protein
MPLISLCRVLLLLTLLAPVTVLAKPLNDFQTWGNITAIGNLGVVTPELKSFKYWLEGQGRFGNNSSTFSQGVLRGGLGYRVNNDVSLWLGYAFVPTDQPFAKIPFDEHDIWEQLLWTHKFEAVTLTSRTRVEQRFIPTGNDVGLRLLQQLKAFMPLVCAPSFSLVASDEYFVNLNKTDYGARAGFDQNWVFAGLGYNFNPNIRTEIGYMLQYINKPVGADRKHDILLLNLMFNY